jgi:hypothetical protein
MGLRGQSVRFTVGNGGRVIGWKDQWEPAAGSCASAKENGAIKYSKGTKRSLRRNGRIPYKSSNTGQRREVAFGPSIHLNNSMAIITSCGLVVYMQDQKQQEI